MKWSKGKNEDFESFLRSDVESFENRELAFQHVREGLEAIYERLILQKEDDFQALVFIVNSMNNYIVMSWYDPKTKTHIGRNKFFLDLPGFDVYLDNDRNFSEQFDDICYFGIGKFCIKHIGPIRPRIKVYKKFDLEKRPTLLRF